MNHKFQYLKYTNYSKFKIQPYIPGLVTFQGGGEIVMGCSWKFWVMAEQTSNAGKMCESCGIDASSNLNPRSMQPLSSKKSSSVRDRCIPMWVSASTCACCSLSIGSLCPMQYETLRGISLQCSQKNPTLEQFVLDNINLKTTLKNLRCFYKTKMKRRTGESERGTNQSMRIRNPIIQVSKWLRSITLDILFYKINNII